MPKASAGLLMYRIGDGELEVFLVHPGGPYWAKQNEGSWTLPKGEYESGEDSLSAAIREFQEETGFTATEPFVELGSVQQKSGKFVAAWAFEGDCNPAELVSNTCEVEWPPRSKQLIVIPEIDRGAWFNTAEAEIFIRKEQQPLLARLVEHLARRGGNAHHPA